MKRVIFLLISVLLVMSCNQNKNGYTADMSGTPAMEVILDEAPAPPPPPAEETPIIVVHEKKIIKDGSLGLKVNDIENSKHRIDSLINVYGAYYANESLTNSDYQSSYNLKIRVPSKNFEKLISDIEAGTSKILYKSIDARDVTEEFIDLETRLENKRNYLKRYNELLKQAKTVKDILEIEEKTRAIEEEIESAEGRLKYLGDQVDFSTLELRLSKEKDYKFIPSNKLHFGERLKQSLSNGWHGFVEFLLFLFKLWPFLIILAVLIPLWKKYKTKKKNRN